MAKKKDEVVIEASESATASADTATTESTNSIKPEDTTGDASTSEASAEDVSTPNTAVVEESKKSDEEVSKADVEVTADTPDTAPVAPEYDEKGEDAPQSGVTVKGPVKVYRGRNIATITAIAAAVVTDGDIVVEKGTKWQPVIFTSKSGKSTKGYIIVK